MATATNMLGLRWYMEHDDKHIRVHIGNGQTIRGIYVPVYRKFRGAT